MRYGILLFALLLTVAPAFGRGSRGSHSGSRGSRSYSSRSYSSHSYYSRSSGGSHPNSTSTVRSSYRSHSQTSHAYRSHPNTSHRSYSTRSYSSRGTSTYSTGQRDGHGRIKRSEAAKDAFKRQHPCPATGKSNGACPGYVIDHVKPLAKGGADVPSNMQWQTQSAAKAKDKWERK